MKVSFVWPLAFLVLFSFSALASSDLNFIQELEAPLVEEGIEHICRDLPAYKAKFCVTRTLESQSQEVLYNMHCLGGSHHNWMSLPLFHFVRKKWKELGHQAPTVITLSFGPEWLLSPKGEAPHSGLYEKVLEELMPLMESTLPFTPLKRHLLGLSMGGPNALQLNLRNPGLFEKTALLCPALATVSPYATPEEVESYILRTGASPARVAIAIYLARKYFSFNDWETQSPLKIAPFTMTRGGPGLYLYAGKTDSFGFFEGSLAFYQEALRSGTSIIFREDNGGHCSFSPTDVAEFFAQK